MFTSDMIFLSVRAKEQVYSLCGHSLEAQCLFSWMSASESISLGGTYYSLAKQSSPYVWGGSGSWLEEVIHFLSLCLNAGRFLVPQESLSQAVEEGPLALQIYCSERSRRHLRRERGVLRAGLFPSPRLGSVINGGSEQVSSHCISPP